MFHLKIIKPKKGDSKDFFYTHYLEKKNENFSNIESIKKYLFEKNEFFHYEFALFNNYLRFFDYHFVSNMIAITQKYINSIQHIPEYDIEIISFYTNMSYFFLEIKSYVLAKKYTGFLSTLVNKRIQDISVSQLYKFKILEAITTGKPVQPIIETTKQLGLD